MSQLQLIYDEVIQKKEEIRDIKELYKSTLVQADEYQEIVEQIRELNEKKKVIQQKLQASLGKAWDKLEDLKHKMKQDKERMTDEALNNFIAGYSVNVEDEFGNEYEPVWSLRFKKVKQLFNQNKNKKS